MSYINTCKVGQGPGQGPGPPTGKGLEGASGACRPPYSSRTSGCASPPHCPAATPPPRRLQRYLQEHGEVHLSALGIAVSGAVTVAEILKNRKLAVEKKLGTTLETLGDEFR